MELESVIKNRHATRKFKDKKIEREILKKILEAGRLAPTAKNIQPIKIYVIENNSLEKLDEVTPCRYGAPTVLLVCGDKKQAFCNADHSTYEMDAVIVGTHMMLEATNVGIDNIWVELFDKNKIKEYFALDNDLVPVCLIPIGYEADDCPDSSNHTVRKELTELVEYR